MMPHDADDELCPCNLLQNSAAYALGTQIGVLSMRLLHGSERRIRETFPNAVQQDVLLLANRAGWRVKGLAPAAPGWFFISLKRRKRKQGAGR